jgi:hypothetical protein
MEEGEKEEKSVEGLSSVELSEANNNNAKTNVPQVDMIKVQEEILQQIVAAEVATKCFYKINLISTNWSFF